LKIAVVKLKPLGLLRQRFLTKVLIARMEYCSSAVSRREVELVVVLASLEYSRAEVNCELALRRFVMFVMYNVVVLVKPNLKDAEDKSMDSSLLRIVVTF
jgi:hypothetical protein